MTCLIHAAAGGVGHVLVQLSKSLGPTVLATVGSLEKAEFVKGPSADRVILYRAHRVARHDRTRAAVDGVMPRWPKGWNDGAERGSALFLARDHTRIGISTYNPLASAASWTTVGAAPSEKRNSTCSPIWSVMSFR